MTDLIRWDSDEMPRSGDHINPNDDEWDERVNKMTTKELADELENTVQAYYEVAHENDYLRNLQEKIDGIKGILAYRRRKK
tara:strand:- start:640 stop:882 length:243 start_codon:yes stop_codon:yes gene_type:complete